MDWRPHLDLELLQEERLAGEREDTPSQPESPGVVKRSCYRPIPVDLPSADRRVARRHPSLMKGKERAPGFRCRREPFSASISQVLRFEL